MSPRWPGVLECTHSTSNHLKTGPLLESNGNWAGKVGTAQKDSCSDSGWQVTFLQQLWSPPGLGATAHLPVTGQPSGDWLLWDSGELALLQMVRSNPWMEDEDASENRWSCPLVSPLSKLHITQQPRTYKGSLISLKAPGRLNSSKTLTSQTQAF